MYHLSIHPIKNDDSSYFVKSSLGFDFYLKSENEVCDVISHLSSYEFFYTLHKVDFSSPDDIISRFSK